jgi:hypothetical protein
MSLEDDSLQAVFQDRDLEVDEEADGEAGEFEIGHELGFMDRQKLFYGLQLDDDSLLDEQVDPVAAIEGNRFVLNGKIDLSTKRYASQGELVAHALFVSRLEQPWAEGPMHLDRRSDNRLRQFLLEQHYL